MGESDLDESDPDDSELPDGDVREEIQKLEHRIEELAEIIERCRKFVLMSKIVIAVGGLLSLAMAFGVIWFDATVMIASITAVIGGAVLLGSNSSTWGEKASALQAAEARRAELISAIDLRVVGGAFGSSNGTGDDITHAVGANGAELQGATLGSKSRTISLGLGRAVLQN